MKHGQEDPGAGRDVRIPVGDVTLDGRLTIPKDARGVVLFAHGSGSSRFSPRNRFVADDLGDAGLATLLIDLLSPEEEQTDLRTRELRFDIPMLARRLVSLVDWLAEADDTEGLKVGLFGSSTGAGAALIAAAERPDGVSAVVSRGGRPDLAGEHLYRVRAPTLLIVGGWDESVIELNRKVLGALRCPNRLEIVPEASHLFEEPGKLEAVARAARDWFAGYLGARDCNADNSSRS
jgi:putative phosphoribosyl transferase